MRTGLPEHPPVEFRLGAIAMELTLPLGRPADRDTIRSQIGQAWPKARVDMAFQDLRGRVDVRISVVHP
jgi:hypothetical protein